MSDITLLCLLQQRRPGDVYTFSVQISKNKTIGELKEVIKKENAPEFDNFPTEDLQLSKIDILDSDVISFFDDGCYGDELPATRYIKDYWVNPPEGYIQVLVEPPKQVIFIPVIGTPIVVIKPKNKFKDMIGCERTEPTCFSTPFCMVYLDMSSPCTSMKLAF